MKIDMESSTTSASISFGRWWDHSIVGTAVDDRGHASIDFARKRSRTCVHMEYDPSNFQVNFNGVMTAVDDFADVIGNLGATHILLECTTLGFVEVFLCCRAIREASGIHVSLLYTEPKDYHGARKRHVLHRRDFDLTEEVFGFAAIPGATFLLREEKNFKAVFLLGYEGQRLDQALEQAPLKPPNCSIVFGVPAFQPGWEMDAFANNIRIIRERGIRGGVRFCGAQSVLGAYEQIREVFQTCREGERLLIAPIGTKPHGIAAALIACEEEVGLLYDHPRRSKGRSTDIAMWHLFDPAIGPHQ